MVWGGGLYLDKGQYGGSVPRLGAVWGPVLRLGVVWGECT